MHSTIFTRKYPSNWFLYFSIFFFTNTSISFLHFSVPAQFFLCLFGLILPLCVAMRTNGQSLIGVEPSFNKQFFQEFPKSVLILGLALCVLIRFYKLDSLFVWPTGDEGWLGTAAIELSKNWKWQFFYSSGQQPSLPIWSAAGLFKLGFRPCLCLWLPSAIVSVLAVVVGYLAARQFFSKSFSLVFTGLFCFNYWPLLLGRLCQPASWFPLWECSCFFFLGRFLKMDLSKESLLKGAGSLGFALGLGPFTFASWPVVAVLVGLVVFKKTILTSDKNPRAFSSFLGFFTISLIPFLIAVKTEGFGQHAASVAAWSGWFPWSHQLPVDAHYFTTLFWGAFVKEAAYTPPWWGFLNPLLSSLFFLGVIEVRSWGNSRLNWWFSCSFLLFLMPGLLTMNVEAMRIVQIMPFLIFGATVGLYAILSNVSMQKRYLLLVLCLMVSCAFDFCQLAQPTLDYHKQPKNLRDGRSAERSRACEILSSYAEKQGPGFIFADFDYDCPNDTTLSVMTYPFNAAYNAQTQGSQPTWSALFVNVNYMPYIVKRFPDSKWYWVAKDLQIGDGGYALAIIPITSQNTSTFDNWNKAHYLMREANLLWNSSGELNWGAAFHSLDEANAIVPFDPFLETIYWEKKAAYYYKKVDFSNCIRAYIEGVQRGYPTAGMFYKIGDLLCALRKPNDAIQFFRHATEAPLDLTQSSVVLSALEHR